MKVTILLGNTRIKSNTEALANIFADELVARGIEVRQVSLRNKNIHTCVGCDKCHSITDSFGCVISDDMQEISKEILSSDLLVFASPIYTWMPTPLLKAVMDRIYAFTKYPAGAEAFNLMKKQKFAMIATSGDECDANCDLFDESVRRMANFAKLAYLGYLSARDYGEGNIVNEKVVNDARVFAEKCAIELTCK